MRGGKRSGPNGVFDSWANVRVGGCQDSDRDRLSKELLLLFVLSSFKLWVFVVLWSREVGISGHGGHGSTQDDEIYIFALRSWV